MGLVVTVRALQWAQFLAKDNIFWLYEITNTGTTTYNKMVFGMLVGTYVGVTSTEDYRDEYTDDWSFYDPTQNITYTGDFKAINGQPMTNPLWVGVRGSSATRFWKVPGNPFDGIDNDGDADSSAVGAGAPRSLLTTDFDSMVLSVGKTGCADQRRFHEDALHDPGGRHGPSHARPDAQFTPGVTKVVEGNVSDRRVGKSLRQSQCV